jgi:hypothetical protein
MKGWTSCLPVAAVLCLLATSCGTSTEMAGTWRDPAYVPAPEGVKKVMVIGIGENDLRIKSFEDQFGRKFLARKLEVVHGSSVIPRDTVSRDELARLVRETGSDLAITSRLVGMEKETEYVPGSSYYAPVGGYSFTPYYYSSYAMVHDPGYMVTYKIYKVETNVYDVATGKMVWSGLSETTDPANAQDAIESMGNRVVNELAMAKIIK